MRGQHNARASVGDNQDRTQRTHTQIKIPDPRLESNPGRRVGRQEHYRPCHGDGYLGI